MSAFDPQGAPDAGSDSAFFRVRSRDPHSLARTGRLRFANGLEVPTPAFMPVGTVGSVKGVWLEDLNAIGVRLILGNTYHLYLRPGHELIERRGGLHRFINWDGALLTDSGGYQVFSLAERMKFLPHGVEFQSHIDGSRHVFTPEGVIDIQRSLGSDIMMVLDDCPPADATPQRLDESLDRTHRWAQMSLAHYSRLANEGRIDPERQRMFGIFQGGLDEARREASLQAIREGAGDAQFAGIAIGGLSVGEGREAMHSMLEFLGPRLDPERPRYLMGVGAAPDLIAAVANGVDMFDCVLPTRNARNGQIFTSQGKRNLRNRQYAERDEPPDPECSCRVCRNYSLAYLRHLFAAGEMLGPMMASLHNLHFLHYFMAEMRKAIDAAKWPEFAARWQKIEF